MNKLLPSGRGVDDLTPSYVHSIYTAHIEETSQ